MKEEIIVSQMNEYLHKAAKALAAWLSDMLPKSGQDWWEECVLSNLSYTQREILNQKKIARLDEFDLAALLRIADKSWYVMRGYAFLPNSDRESIRDMYGVRNNWAHCGAELPGKDTIVSDIDKLSRFFYRMGQDDVLVDLNQLKLAVERPDLYPDKKVTPTITTPEFNQSTDQPVSQAEEKIKENSMVYIVGNPESRGIVISVSSVGSTKKYSVFVNGAIKTFYDGQIAPVQEEKIINWVDTETLRSYLSAYQINNPSSANLYSLNSARIDFVPYQFRPALKLIKADEPRLLIADSVGVGKTIEAGLIIKELQARSDLENIMVICPKPLVADRKWENEMKRFDEDFIAVDAPTLREIISNTDRDGLWPVRYSKTIVPYSILDSRTYYGSSSKKQKSFGLVDLDPAPHFDLVIIDEAHHLRNGSMEKDKAFAYKCVHYFCEHADAVIMLTATPLQTGNDDLFTLLNLLRPDVVIDKQSFEMMAKPNPYISQCSHLVRSAQENWNKLALAELEKVLSTQWGESVIAKDPTFSKVVSMLGKELITREERVNLITDIESLHSFNMMLTRTRRKDIQDFCIRRTFTLESDFTPEQRALHDALLGFEMAALSTLHNGRGIQFMMSTIRRQASSCIFGLAPHIRDIIEKRFEQILEDPDFELDPEELDKVNLDSFKTMADTVLHLADNLPDNDPKFDGVLEIINEKQKQENNKIILFSTFLYTLHYVKQKLLNAGIRVAQIDGSVGNDDRLELRQRFELPKSDPDAIDVLLFTEVGSEGLDYQFCDTMINYDLPWNPMRIEQRIGRIDRRGQVSEAVNIYNVITRDTVDADIYNRCLLRIGVFEGSIGECEAILGEIGSQIEAIALDTNLTDAERRDKLEQMADNEIRKAQELNRLESEEKELFGFNLSNYTVSKEIREAESPFLTAKSLQHLVEMYLEKRLGKGNYILGESSLKTLRLNSSARAELATDLRNQRGVRNSLRRVWEVYLKGNDPNHQITFESETAENYRNAFFITPVHPLVKQAAAFFASNEQVYIHLEYYSDDLVPGDYPFSIYAWDYVGIRPNFKLVTVCEKQQLSDELPEYILTANEVDYPTEISDDSWTALEEKHVALWQTEKKKHADSTRQVASYKLESLKNNFRNRRLVLERKIAEADDERIVKMRSAELDNAEQRYKKKVAEIESKIAQADIHTTLIANGIITVKGI